MQPQDYFQPPSQCCHTSLGQQNPPRRRRVTGGEAKPQAQAASATAPLSHPITPAASERPARSRAVSSQQLEDHRAHHFPSSCPRSGARPPAVPGQGAGDPSAPICWMLSIVFCTLGCAWRGAIREIPSPFCSRHTEAGIGHPKAVAGWCSSRTHVCKATVGMGVSRSGLHPSCGTGTEIGGPGAPGSDS